MTRDYKTTVFLPKTEFPMRAGLPKKEPDILAHWERIGLWDRQRETSRGRPTYVLHDGPPYANGNIHVGTATNKILKDIVSRSHQMLGYDSIYVPGWDCHGLPIEWKIEEKYRAEGRDKDAVPINEFRRECRDFAQHWLTVQMGEFQRLGVFGDWDGHYSTMKLASEADIVAEIHKFLMNGGLYRGDKPVLWSVVEKTALAEAEVEYHDHTSTTIHVRFPVVEPSVPALAGASILIWTTTPWTIPGNRALAFGAEIAYGVYRVDGVMDESLARPGERLVLATALAEAVQAAIGVTGWTLDATVTGAEIAGTVCAHPLRGVAETGGHYDFAVRPFAGNFVTTEVGTGFVHIAPGHGEDDFLLGQANGVEVPQTVGEDGSYYPHVALFAGRRVYRPDGRPGDANKAVVEALRTAGGLAASGQLRHSYPHSWRSKAPLIFRNTPQWFISMERNALRQTALDAIAATRWVPPQGENRIRSMIETRPDWCISRQRAWGVPIAIFVRKSDGQPLRDQAVCDRIVAAFRDEGSDAWFRLPAQHFLGDEHRAEDFEQVRDIVDVWFESGCTHAFVLERRPDLKWPADIYLEGSDQHRGWFHSSLLESCGTRGRAPYNAVLTHGFVLDEQGRKMSKSLGNTVLPQKVVDEYGADILRCWVVGSDYTEDLRIGPELLKAQAELYRRLRNTLRYMLGALDGWSEDERLPLAEMPDLERWVLHRLWQLDRTIRAAIADHDYHTQFTALHNFCAVDLSAFYFDVRKDSLYCDAPTTMRRRATRTVMWELFSCLTAWLAPILCFTAEEAWLARPGAGPDDSIHLRGFPEVPEAWRDDALALRWELLRGLRRVVTGALERERAEKRIGSSLQAHPLVHVDERHAAALSGVDLAELAITSAASITTDPAPDGAFTLTDVPGVAVLSRLAEGTKCDRCWQVLPEVGSIADHPTLCRRCASAVALSS